MEYELLNTFFSTALGVSGWVLVGCKFGKVSSVPSGDIIV